MKLSQPHCSGELARLSRYLRFLADQLGLRDWRLDVGLGELEPDELARIGCVPGRKLAVLTFDPDFFQHDEEIQRYCCVHELLHPHLQDIRDSRQCLERSLSPQQVEMFQSVQDQAVERAVDALATIMSKSLPTMRDTTYGMAA